jgi:hypothetical protein
MEDRWDCMKVVCIKEYKTLKVGSFYSIKGRGDLSFNADPEVDGRKGYGFCIEDENDFMKIRSWQLGNQYGYHSGRKDWWNLPYAEKIKWYYFTEKEMSEYFISDEENWKMVMRDEKLTGLGI